MSREFVIRITTDYSDAEAALRAAGEKIACELDWGGDATTSIEVIETSDPPTYIAGWEMEPGEDDAHPLTFDAVCKHCHVGIDLHGGEVWTTGLDSDGELDTYCLVSADGFHEPGASG